MRPRLIEKPAPAPFIAKSRAAMGQKAAEDVADELRHRLQSQQGVRMIFAAAPSQSEMLSALILMPDVDWSRVTAFHMDEYLGLASDAPQRFGLWLRHAIFDRLPFAAVHLLEPGTNPEASAAEYADKLAESPVDIVCCGIGSNGHLAFNDPPADLNDPSDVKVVEIRRRLPPATSRRSLFRPVRRRPHARSYAHHSTPARSRPHLLLCPRCAQENRRT